MNFFFASLIFGVALIGCVLSWWFGKCSADKDLDLARKKLRECVDDLQRERNGSQELKAQISRAVSYGSDRRFAGIKIEEPLPTPTTTGRKRNKRGRFSR